MSKFSWYMLVLFVFMPASKLYCQKSKPYESLTLSLQYLHNINHNEFHRYWNETAGIGIGLETPFNTGELHCGMNVLRFDAHQSQYMDFTDFYIYAGWGITARLHNTLLWQNSVHIGAHQMYFEKEKNDAFKYESEIGYMGTSTLAHLISPNCHAYISFSYQEIFTHHRIHLSHLSSGCSFSFTTPAWLKEVLR